MLRAHAKTHAIAYAEVRHLAGNVVWPELS